MYPSYKDAYATIAIYYSDPIGIVKGMFHGKSLSQSLLYTKYDLGWLYSDPIGIVSEVFHGKPPTQSLLISQMFWDDYI